MKFLIYIDNEKYEVTSQDLFISYHQVIELAGYPETMKYIIRDELTSIIYCENDMIPLQSNLSLVIIPK